MVARPATPFRSGNAGELSPDVKGRVDIKQYYSGGLAYKNIEPVPQSGWRQMGGTWRQGFVRKPLVAQPITDPSTDAGPHTGTQTVWTGTVTGNVSAVFVEDFAIDAGTATFIVEGLFGGAWIALAPSFSVATGAPASRFAALAPGAQKTLTGLRIRATFSTSAAVTIAAVDAFEESGTANSPRYVKLTTDENLVFSAFVNAGFADFFTDDGYQGSVRLATVTAAMLPDLDLYAEGNTIGVFHGQLTTVRLFLADAATTHDWRADLWPYESYPTADLGGTYPKTDDIWDLTLTFGDTTTTLQLTILLTVDGEPTTPVTVTDAGGTPVAPDQGTADYALFAANLQAALQALPSVGAGATVAISVPWAFGSVTFTITFGGALSGREFQVSATVTNTSTASALPVHRQFGKSDFEPIFSASRGWPGLAELIQDRFGLARIPALRGAMTLSEAGEYFTFNIKKLGDNAARLDKIRSQTSETIVALKESKYILVFTNLGVYFITNRTIERNTPLNFVLASEVGAQPNCRPFDLEGLLYYVAINPQGLAFAAEGGAQLLSLSYDDVSTSYNAVPESLLASHLATAIIRTARQTKTNDLDAAKGWQMRADGRLVAAQVIKNQEILGYCEWIAAAGGLVREIGIDGENRLWLAVRRGNDLTIEIYDTTIFLQDAVLMTPDLAGNIADVPFANGSVLWALADGYVVGPLTVSAGAVSLGDAYTSAMLGRWQAPRFESMPHVHVTPNDDVILRPGRIHTAHVNVIDTTSIAVGANGEPAQDIRLLESTDPVDAPMPAKTKMLTVTGEDLPGMVEGTTLVITQTRPGRLRIRDFAVGTKL